MKIDDLWAAYEQATSALNTGLGIALLACLAAGVIIGIVMSLNNDENIGWWLLNILFCGFMGGLVGVLLAGILGSMLSFGPKMEMAEDVRARAMMEHGVDLPADTYREVIFKSGNTDTHEAEMFFGRLEGKTATFALDFDKGNKTLNIATSSTKDEDTRMDVLTD